MQQHVMLSTETSLAPFDHKELSQYIKGAPEVYTELTNRSQKAIEAGHELLDKIKERGMDEELAAEITNFIKKAKSTKELSKQKRTPITQMFQAVSKAFTAIESDIQDMADKLKKVLDDYATEQARIARQKREEAEKKAAAEKEKADLEAEAEKGLRTSFINLLALKKTYLNSVLENMTLPTVDTVISHIRSYDQDLPAKELKWPSLFPVYTSEDELKDIKKKVGARLAQEMKSSYSQEISDLKKELLDKIPSKTAELNEMEKANAKERRKLQEQAELRKKEEEKRLHEESERKKKEAEAEAKAKSDAAAMNVMFEVEQSTASTVIPKGKPVFEIIVTHQQAYADMFAMWWSKEGGNMPMDKLEKVTLGKIRNFFEKMASDTGEKLQSKFLKYEERFSVSTRR